MGKKGFEVTMLSDMWRFELDSKDWWLVARGLGNHHFLKSFQGFWRPLKV